MHTSKQACMGMTMNLHFTTCTETPTWLKQVHIAAPTREVLLCTKKPQALLLVDCALHRIVQQAKGWQDG